MLDAYIAGIKLTKALGESTNPFLVTGCWTFCCRLSPGPGPLPGIGLLGPGWFKGSEGAET